jgi:hypothetical protein
VPGPWSTRLERSGGRIRRESPAWSIGRELRSGGGKALKPQKSSAAGGVFDESPRRNGCGNRVALGEAMTAVRLESAARTSRRFRPRAGSAATRKIELRAARGPLQPG